jgi:hypothetical protein
MGLAVMCRLRTAILVSVMLALSIAEPRGDDKVLPAGEAALPTQSLWAHNGSVVHLTAEGASRRFYYDTPRQGLDVIGVRRGTLLFEGRKEGNRYSGTAYFFSKQCGQRPYAVSGSVASRNSQITITMSGQAPRLDANCQQIGVHNDVLVFHIRRMFLPAVNGSRQHHQRRKPVLHHRRIQSGPKRWMPK